MPSVSSVSHFHGEVCSFLRSAVSREQKPLGEERKEDEAAVRMDLRYLWGGCVYWTCEDRGGRRHMLPRWEELRVDEDEAEPSSAELASTFPPTKQKIRKGSEQNQLVVHQRNLQVASSRPDLRINLELRLELKPVPATGPVPATPPLEAEGEELLLSARCRGNSGC